jgi:hypothetical protein
LQNSNRESFSSNIAQSEIKVLVKSKLNGKSI